MEIRLRFLECYLVTSYKRNGNVTLKVHTIKKFGGFRKVAVQKNTKNAMKGQIYDEEDVPKTGQYRKLLKN